MKTLTIFQPKWIFITGMVLLLPLFGGCQDDGLPDEVRTLNDAYAVIVGEWEWTKSVMAGYFGGTVQTPESEGLTKRYVFNRDGAMRLIENGNIVQDSEYRIEVYEGTFLLRIMETGGSSGMSFRADTLVLSNRAFGHAHYYIRK